MNTEQIMALAEKWRRTRVCEWAVSDSYKALQAAIEALVQERDALKAELGDLPESQAAMLRENKVLRDALEKIATCVPASGNEAYCKATARAALTRSKS